MADGTGHDGVLELKTFLWARDVPWSAEQTEQLISDFADFLADRGLANDDGVHSMIFVKQVDLPEDLSELVSQLVVTEGWDLTIPTEADV